MQGRRWSGVLQVTADVSWVTEHGALAEERGAGAVALSGLSQREDTWRRRHVTSLPTRIRSCVAGSRSKRPRPRSCPRICALSFHCEEKC
ncbi:hypothetical protein SKAU_G00063900 [Synaphobranchus kaupii]|uniref:Uncharacterized protein n=1 Tax=Synaphobranchus kaupii TaxID=118154 RepID=A0A9Q1JB07_SYNKA|nr:hypothetical protein SKAU_G00063900 [Synaphobranchus kaupii]